MYSQAVEPKWMDTFLVTARAYRRGTGLVKRLRRWTRAFIADRHDLPVSMMGTWNATALENEELVRALCLHLRSLGPHLRVLSIVEYLAVPDIQR